MPRYVDGFVIPIPRKNIAAYKKMAAAAGKVWLEHGALEFMECIGEDIKSEFGLSFPKLANLKRTETILFSFIVYKSRKHRDSVNKKVMADKRITRMMEGKKMPFDMDRMTYGGFEALVDMAKK